jgi:hypothetical protein
VPAAIVRHRRPTRVAQTGELAQGSDAPRPAWVASRHAAPSVSVCLDIPDPEAASAELIEALARQEGLAGISLTISTRNLAALPPAFTAALNDHFSEERLRIQVWNGGGRADRLLRVAASAPDGIIVSLAQDILPFDTRTVLHLASAASRPGIGSVGCVVGDWVAKAPVQAGGYSLGGLCDRALPVLRFGTIDPDVLKGFDFAVTAANCLGLMAARSGALRSIASTCLGNRPEAEQDIAIGLALIEAGWANLCLSTVRAQGPAQAVNGMLNRAIYLGATTLPEIRSMTTLVQRVM